VIDAARATTVWRPDRDRPIRCDRVPEGGCICEDCPAGFETIRDDFASLDDWDDRYRYVIELGHTVEPFGKAAHNESNKVRGCVSQVWLEREARMSADGQAILHYRGDSAHLVRGLIAISISLFSDRAPKQILAVDALGAFRALGLEQHLTPQRSNGARHDRAHPRGRRCSLSSASIRLSDRQKRRDFRVPPGWALRRQAG
jgi:cysteine desulfuration protein SufE